MDQKLPDERTGGCIVVVAKCPRPGTSKTRLAPLLGDDGASTLAKAMLSDVLLSLSSYVHVSKILLYAPGNVDGWNHMSGILQEIKITRGWKLIPMEEQEQGSLSLTSSDLGTHLTRALVLARAYSKTGGVLFLGMDSPELPLDEIDHALYLAAHCNTALLCPANDGGYGLLSVPHCAPTTIFQGVLWSHAQTALSQLKALSDANVAVTIGRMMYDIDEPNDVIMLAHRFVEQCTNNTNCIRHSSSSGKATRSGDCKYTMAALKTLGILVINDKGKYHVKNSS